MPVEYTACVASVIKSGKAKDDAQRICAISFNKRFGISPQAAHKIDDWKGWKKSHGFEDLKITFIGTGSLLDIPRLNCDDPQCREARAGGKSKRSSPGILIEKGETRVAIGAGADFEEQVKKYDFKPDAILLTNSCQDHTGGLNSDSNTSGITVYASEETCGNLRGKEAIFEDNDAQTWPRGQVKKFNIGEISFEAFPVAHSTESPCVAFKIDDKVIYAPDFLGTKHWDMWKGIKLAIMDGTSLSRDLVKHERGIRVSGHISMKNSGKRVLNEGAERVIFTHIGHVFHGHDGLKRKIRSYFGGDANVAYDGMELKIPYEGMVQLADSAKSGIYLNSPYGKMIWNGDATAIVRPHPLKTHLFESLYLASGDLVYGVIELSGGEPMSLKQFEERRDKHKISDEERLKEMGGTKELYFFDVKMIDKFDKPKQYKREKGVQTFIKEVKFIESKPEKKPDTAMGLALSAIKDQIQTTDILDAAKELPVAKNVDLKILTNTELKELHELCHGWYCGEPPKDWSLEDIAGMDQRITQEFDSRDLKHPLHNDKLDEAIKALSIKAEENKEPKIKTSMILEHLQKNLPEEITVEKFVSSISSVVKDYKTPIKKQDEKA